MLVRRGPKHRPPPVFAAARRSISAVSRMTSLVSGGDLDKPVLSARRAAFCSAERSASNCEIACARRISAFSGAAFDSAEDMIGRLSKGAVETGIEER